MRDRCCSAVAPNITLGVLSACSWSELFVYQKVSFWTSKDQREYISKRNSCNSSKVQRSVYKDFHFPFNYEGLSLHIILYRQLSKEAWNACFPNVFLWNMHVCFHERMRCLVWLLVPCCLTQDLLFALPYACINAANRLNTPTPDTITAIYYVSP